MFQLKKGNQTFDFDINGAVQSAGIAAGKWTTNKSNQIVVTHVDGCTDVFDVAWGFNGSNQLRILSGGNELFNFHATTALPLYSAQKDVLVVQPAAGQPFTFPLRGSWGIDAQHNLTLAIGAQNSTIDGFLQDADSQFSYHFFDLANVAGGNESVLTFPGVWRHATENGVPKLDFDYEKDDGGAGTFDLPAKLDLDPNINEFVYNYDKNSQSFQVQFAGTLHIDSDFKISYRLSTQTSSGTGITTTFNIDAMFHKNDFDGDLKLAVRKSNGAPGAELSLGGSFAPKIGTSTLQVGFNYAQPASGHSQTIGFNGTFKSATGTDVQWAFTRNSTAMTVDLSTHVVIGSVRTEEKFNLTAQNGHIVGIHALLGIHF